MSAVNPSDQLPEPDRPATPIRPRRRRITRVLIFVVAVFFGLVIFGSVAFVGATTLEEHDDFCTSCHTVPETTYFQRATTAKADLNALITDMATYHYHQAQAKGQTFSCIQCHRGDSSLTDRLQTLALGGQDTITFVRGKADPSIEKTAIMQPALVNAACISCHADVLLTVNGTRTHFHNFLPQTAALLAQGKQLINSNPNGRSRPIRAINTSLDCTSCHLAHKTVDTTNPQLKLVDATITQAACDTCHQAAGERPQSLDRLLNGGGD